MSSAQLDAFARGQIVAYKKAGWGPEEIASAVRKKDGTHPCERMVQKVLAKARRTRRWRGQDSKAGGRPSKLSPATRKELVQLV